jgi:hypothetical protein
LYHYAIINFILFSGQLFYELRLNLSFHCPVTITTPASVKTL